MIFVSVVKCSCWSVVNFSLLGLYVPLCIFLVDANFFVASGTGSKRGTNGAAYFSGATVVA